MTIRILLAGAIAAAICGCSTQSPPPPTAVAPGASGATATPSDGSAPATMNTSPNPNGWRLLADFPINGAAQVSSIAATDKGFVAVGTAADASATCDADTNHGRVWTSTDGVSWTSQKDDDFAQTLLTNVVAFNGATDAIGLRGSLDTESPCPSPALPPGTTVWRSADAGVSWQQLTQSATLARASVADLIVAGGKLLAVGSDIDSEGNEQGATWTSADGQTWSAAELPPNAPNLAIAAAKDNVVVGFGDDQDFPLPWISRDGGGHWYEESIDVAGADAATLSLSIEAVTTSANGFVAVGSACCIGAQQLVPIVISSRDGTQWQGAAVPADHPQQIWRVAQLGDRLLAVGSQTTVEGVPGSADLGGRSWVSADDGATWLAGPAFPELGDGNVTAIAVGSSGVVVAGVTFNDSTGADTGVRVWFAPIGAFAGVASH